MLVKEETVISPVFEFVFWQENLDICMQTKDQKIIMLHAKCLRMEHERVTKSQPFSDFIEGHINCVGDATSERV